MELKKIGFVALGLDATGSSDISDAAKLYSDRPIALILGAEGPGLRSRTKEVADALLKLSRYHHLAHSMCLMPQLLVCILLQQYEKLVIIKISNDFSYLCFKNSLILSGKVYLKWVSHETNIYGRSCL